MVRTTTIIACFKSEKVRVKKRRKIRKVRIDNLLKKIEKRDSKRRQKRAKTKKEDSFVKKKELSGGSHNQPKKLFPVDK